MLMAVQWLVLVCEQCCNLMLVETITKAPLNFHLVPFNNPRVQFTVQVPCLLAYVVLISRQQHKILQWVKLCTRCID